MDPYQENPGAVCSASLTRFLREEMRGAVRWVSSCFPVSSGSVTVLGAPRSAGGGTGLLSVAVWISGLDV